MRISRRAAFLAGVIAFTVVTVSAAAAAPSGRTRKAGPVPYAAGRLHTGTGALSMCTHRVPSDFNGDGFADLAIGEPILGSDGNLHIVFGDAAGVNPVGSQTITRTSLGITTPIVDGTEFPVQMVSGYFNDDCFADLAVVETDRTLVLFGAAHGLTESGYTVLSAAGTLAAGDFNGDGRDDLAAGESGGAVASGRVQVFLSGTHGPSAASSNVFGLATPGVPGSAEAGDLFGQSLAAGDFNGDGKADLAIGAPGETVGNVPGAGSVTVLVGTSAGLSTAGAFTWTQGSPGVPERVEAQDHFAWALAAGDVNGDGRADLAVGVPGESDGRIDTGGMVEVFAGSASGLTTAGSTTWTQDSAGVPGAAEKNDRFGWAVAFGDFNGDGRADLAVDVNGEAVGTVLEAGLINVIYGSPTGLTGTGAQAWSEGAAGFPGTATSAERMGVPHSVAGVHTDQLIVGVPSRDTGDFHSGAVIVVDGGTQGLTSTGSALWTPSTLGGGPQSSGMLGATMG